MAYTTDWWNSSRLYSRFELSSKRLGAASTAWLNRSMLALIGRIGQHRLKLLERQGFQPRWVQTAVGRLYCLEACNTNAATQAAPTWVFLHGYASQALDWCDLLRLVQPHCRRILALDLPGHGQSPVSPAGLNAQTLTTAVLQSLELLLQPQERCIVVGSSMGGLGAIRYAQHMPQRVAGLVLLSPAGAPMRAAELDTLLQIFRINNLDAALRFVDKLYVNGVWARTLTGLAVMAHLNKPALQQLLHEYRTYPLLTAAEVAALPASLLIWGDSDTILPHSSKAFFSRHLDAERSVVVSPSNFGHTPFLDRPQEVARIILDWAKHTELATTSA